ncbi:acyltransferase family protein [Candidatus Poribacteria bacterium]|nr:acyltransferase family protein [Candidatus Poribacteria bacterium]
MDTRTSAPQRHDIEALRALSMLLIIAFYGSLAFFDVPWPVRDMQKNEGFGVFFLVVHGFQMPLFFMTSGFFTAMLWRTRGVRGMLEHRFRRLFMPLVFTLITIAPLTYWINEQLIEATLQRARDAAPSPSEDSKVNIWVAVKTGNREALNVHFANGTDLDTQDPQTGLTPLSWAIFVGKVETVEQLIRAGADINGKNRDGGTPLHEAAFMGRDQIARVLLQNDADVEATDENGKTPLNRAQADWTDIYVRVGELQVKLDPVKAYYGRTRIATILKKYESREQTPNVKKQNRLWRTLTTGHVFAHLWIFWLLCWLVLAFALYATIAERRLWRAPPEKMMLSPLRYLWLIPLTMVPQWFMSAKGAIPNFGPDNFIFIIPMPYIPIYYAIFFLGGAFYYDCDDSEARVGKQWIVTMPLALLVIFPVTLTLELSQNTLGGYRHLVLLVLKATFAWVMVFSLIGIARELISRESRVWRYLSDVAYWLYLAHLPLLLVVQEMARTWELPSVLKFGLVCFAVTGILLLIHQFFLRYTFLGTLLNRNQ